MLYLADFSWLQELKSNDLFLITFYLATGSAIYHFLILLWSAKLSKQPRSTIDVDGYVDEPDHLVEDFIDDDVTLTHLLGQARLAGNILLLCLATITLWREMKHTTENSRRVDLMSTRFHLSMWLTFAYTTAMAGLILWRPNMRYLARHANIILLSLLAIYSYRDVWPLATYDLIPLDTDAEGNLVWVKVATLVCIAALIPICMPRQYQPVDPKLSKLMPSNPKNPMVVPNPKDTASWLSRGMFFFLDPLVWEGYRQKTHLRFDQLPPLSDYHQAKYHTARAGKFLDPLRPGRKYIAWGLLRYFWRDYLSMGASVCCSSVVGFAAPTAINKILRYMEAGPASSHIRPWFWLALLLLGPMLHTVLLHWFMSVGTAVRVSVEALVTHLVLEHSLRMRLHGVAKEGGKDARDTTNQHTGSQIGKIHTLVTADLSNILGVVDILNFIIQIPMMTALSIIFLYQILGWSALVGAASIIAFVPIPGWIGKKIIDVQTKRMKETDARVGVISEAVRVMRMIKLFGWEQKMMARIEEKRVNELYWIWRIMLLKISNNIVGMIITSSTIFITYGVYTTVMKEELNASKIFSTMAVFDILRTQIDRVAWRMTTVIQAKVSFDRLDKFLTTTPLLDSYTMSKHTGLDQSIAEGTTMGQEKIGFQDAAFVWVSDKDASGDAQTADFRLRIDGELLFVKHGLNVITGPTGSGKTSMLLALLSEMKYIPLSTSSWFGLPRRGGVSYVAQESWVQNATVKENILFGAPYDAERYLKVVYQCALERDILSFDGGDNAEVGERGITLSGGQKIRLTLARAVYSNSETLLLDDVFASVDAHTSAWLVDKCLRGELLKDRTVILVTHSVPLVARLADLLVSINPDGTVSALEGKRSDTFNLDLSPTSDTLELENDSATTEETAQRIALISPSVTSQDITQGKLISAEEIVEGHITFKSLKLFLGAMGGRHSVIFSIAFILLLTLSRVTIIMRVWFLGYWGSQYEIYDPREIPVQRFLLGFLAILTCGILITSATQICYNFRVLAAVRRIHAQLMASIFGAMLRWLDETPSARIISRCTQDIRSVDEPIPQSTYQSLDFAINVLTKLGAIVIFTPLFIIPASVVSLAGILIGSIYLRSQLAVKRQMSNARSPILAHLDAATHGLVSIRAYNAGPTFLKESLSRIDSYSRVAQTTWNLNRWISIRIDFLGTSFTAILAIYLVYGTSVGAANSGFALNMALEFCTFLYLLIRSLNDLEVECNSLERIQGFLDIDHEPKSVEGDSIPAAWPTSGDLRVVNLSAKYSYGGPQILHNVTFHLKSGEHIGIVGRTGSGKSSLALALLRCILTDGNIYLDGVETKSVNLDRLRTNITIIPQTPELLSGTLRQNLDPFGQHSDATLIDALQATGFFSLRRRQDDSSGHVTLETLISGAGENFSVGERQIIALARAIIRRSKVLILDEATSAIDRRTDSLIQENLRSQAKSDVTVITIAHRLETVMDADRIMVLDGGRVIEFDSPEALLSSPRSAFKKLVEEGHKSNL